MTGVVCPDTNEFTGVPRATGLRRYNHDFLIFRVSFGTSYLDRKFLQTAAATKALFDAGVIAGAVGYGVPIFAQGTAEQHVDFLTKQLGPTPPDWLAGLMQDLETWNGASYEQHGDHSDFVDEYDHLCEQYMGGGARAIDYGNEGDLAELAPHRKPRPAIVASYGPQLVVHDVPGAIGQQYTNGQVHGPKGLPLRTRGIGACDHNYFPGFSDGHALRAFLRPTGEHMNKAEVEKMIQHAVTPLHRQNKSQRERLNQHGARLRAAEKQISDLGKRVAADEKAGK